MKMISFCKQKNATPEQRKKNREGWEYLTAKNTKGKYIHGSIGIRGILHYLIKQQDIIQIDTEVSFCENKRLKTDIAFIFDSGVKGVIEFNGTQHFSYSSMYPDKQSYTKQNKSLLHKETICLNLGYSCLNFNDLTYVDNYIDEGKETPYIQIKERIIERYNIFFQNMEKGDCVVLRKVLDNMKINCSILSYNLKLQDKNWKDGFRTSYDKELDQILFNMCNNDMYSTYI